MNNPIKHDSIKQERLSYTEEAARDARFMTHAELQEVYVATVRDLMRALDDIEVLEDQQDELDEAVSAFPSAVDFYLDKLFSRHTGSAKGATVQ